MTRLLDYRDDGTTHQFTAHLLFLTFSRLEKRSGARPSPLRCILHDSHPHTLPGEAFVRPHVPPASSAPHLMADLAAENASLKQRLAQLEESGVRHPLHSFRCFGWAKSPSSLTSHLLHR